MLKEIIKGIVIGIMSAIAISPLTVKAETRQERWIRIQKESNEEFMQGLEKDGNLTEEAKEELSWNNKTNKTNSKTKKKKNTTENKGYVYGVDELHVIGLPTDEETGYTKSGDYGKIE